MSERYLVVRAAYPLAGYAARFAVIDTVEGLELGRLFRRENAELLRDALQVEESGKPAEARDQAASLLAAEDGSTGGERGTQ